MVTVSPMRAVFSDLPQAHPDPIFAVAAEAARAGSGALNGTIGVYLGEDGKPFVFPSIRAALQDFGRRLPSLDTSYPPLLGLPRFRECVGRLLLGERRGVVASIATTGGTGALAVNLRLLQILLPDVTVVLSQPTWPNHLPLCAAAGVPVAEAPYLSAGTPTMEGIVEGLKRLRGRAAVILQSGCHNTTGLDFTHRQWEELATILRTREGTVVVLDIAYQGFGGAPEEDMKPLRILIDHGVPILVAWSASKNHALYAFRTGLACVPVPDEETQHTVEAHFSMITRGLHSAAPTVGQEVVVLVQEEYREPWLSDLAEARELLKRKREDLRSALPESFGPALSGRGMYALLPLAAPQIDRLRREQQVFLTGDGRLNIAAIPLARIAELADKVRRISS